MTVEASQICAEAILVVRRIYKADVVLTSAQLSLFETAMWENGISGSSLKHKEMSPLEELHAQYETTQ